MEIFHPERRHLQTQVVKGNVVLVDQHDKNSSHLLRPHNEHVHE